MEYAKKNGYELACHVLHHEHGGVEALLRLAGNNESCWLEMKAGMELTQEDRKRGEKPADLYWNIARAAIEIMNTSGGVLLIGIHDKTHDAVPLEDNDPRHIIEKEGLEAYFRREIYERIWPDKKEWKSGNGKTVWSVDPEPEHGLVEVVQCEYRGKTIAAVLIKPAQKCVHCIRRENNMEGEYILAREPGEIGKVKEISRSGNIAAYEANREIETVFLGELYARFEREVGEKSEAGILDRAIRQYYERFAESVSKNRLFERSCFTPLDGSGDLEAEDMNDFMSPEAEEIFGPEEDDWLDPEDHDDEDDEDKPDPEDDDESDEDDEDEDSAYREHRSGDLITLMEEIPRMLVLGEPGGGKTTTLINFTLRFQKENPGEPLILAVYILMGRWLAGGSIEQLLNKSTGLSSEQWSILIRQNRLRLVIDAFNECPDMYQDAALLNIRNFLQAHPDLPGVISSRTAERLKELRLPMFTVEPMDQEHQKKYLIRYLNDEAAAEELLNRLNAMSGGTVLAANPMLLRMIVEVFRDSHQLPAGRAGLYHQWLKQWYSREYGKAKTAGSPLPWDFSAALDILSELALRGRFHGYRDIPLEFAREILQDRGPECINKLCQGPVVTIDDEFIRFRHETFQEYLCAEKLVQKPELVEQIPKADAEQWTMVLAYASELQWPMPDTLWRFAWKVDKWFGIALTDNQRVLSTDNSQFKPENMVYFHALQGTWDDDLQHGLVWKKDVKYTDGIKKVLSYIISANDEIYARWLKFELRQLWYCSASLDLFTSFCQRSIALKFRLQSKKQTLEQCLSSFLSSPKIPDGLRAQLQAIPSRINEVFRDIDLNSACLLIQTGVIGKEVFSDKVPNWISKTYNFYTANSLIQSELATKEDFSDRVTEWIKQAKPKTVMRLIHSGFATKEDFVDKIPEWIKQANPEAARQVIQLGFATKEDFADRVTEWIKQANPKAAMRLIYSGFATNEDFADRGPEWIKQANPETAKQLIKLGVATKENLIKSASLGKAKQLIKLGVAAKDDFADKVPEWIASATPKTAKQLIECGLTTEEDFMKMKRAMTKQKYCSYLIADKKTARQMRRELAGKKWQATVQKAAPLFSFFVHEEFSDNIYCSNTVVMGGQQPEVGSIWEIEVSVKLDKKRNRYGFTVSKAKFLSASQTDAVPSSSPCVKTPVTSDPDKKPIPQPVTSAVQPKPSVSQKTKQPAQKTKIKTVKGIKYDPEIDLGDGMSAIGGVTDFSRDADHIRIYIDEAWPGCHDDSYKNVGVISGIVWLGNAPNYEVLPAVPTHLRENFAPKAFRGAISNLLNCSDMAFPFAFPIFKDAIYESDYPELLRIALITLLGWILPQNGKECEVEIFCEGIGTSQMVPGKNCADQFKEIRNTVELTAGRMQRWNISKFISMKADDKEFEYIPYADAVGYLTIPTQKARKWGKPFQVENWPGYVPVSQDLLKRLVHLDSDSPAGYADELFEFARNRQKTKLFSYVLKQAFRKAESSLDFKTALFEKLEKMFEEKKRDLPLLDHLCKELSKRFPLDNYEGCPRQKLIRILVELQNANHAGDPERAKECVRLYSDTRNALLKQNLDFCVYTDMNLAVHYNDMFDFSSSAAICRNWEGQPGFEYMSRENQGRVLSSIGQSYSISGDYGKAEEYFRRAIEIFGDPANPLPGQADHTRVYLALNALDAGNFEAAAEFAEQVFGCSFAEAIAKYAGNTDKPFHHHLLVKNLNFNPKAASLRPAYLQTAQEWTGEEQHPWELIELYRALLLHEAGKTVECRARFEAMHSLYAELGSGAIMQLLKAFALTVQMILETDSLDELRLERNSLLDQAVKFLPAAGLISQKLRGAKQLDPNFWKLLPFNYK